MKNTAKYFVLQIGSLISLYAFLGALIALLFGVIDIALPDAASSYWEAESARSTIRFSIATLVVLFPTYLILTRQLQKGKRDADAEHPIASKWLHNFSVLIVYLSLLLGGAILLGDLIYVLNTFLNGELVTRTILKALTTFGVIGAAFTYYLLDVRDYWKTHEQQSILYGTLAAVVVLISLVLGYVHIETPAEVREQAIDANQVEDLMRMQSAIEEYYRTNGSLPERIEDTYLGRDIPTAPEAREAYTYEVTAADTFELCATFAHDSQESMVRPIAEPYYVGGALKGTYSWEHDAGRWCFTRVIRPFEE